MPNWCDNTITFDQDVEDNAELIHAFQQQNPFQLIRPCPEELSSDAAHTYGGDNAEAQDALRASLKAKYGYANAYDWHCARWGTKWDACDIDCESDGLTFHFSTAWSPPVALYEYIAKHYPGARFDFSYEEGGCGFAGEGYVRNGRFSDIEVPYVYESDDESEDEPEQRSAPIVGQATVLPLP